MSYISVSSKRPFGTIQEVCNSLFQTNYIYCRGKAYFKPRTFKKLKLDKYKLWFPKIGNDKTTGWNNQLINNETGIVSKNATSPPGTTPIGQESIVFVYIENEYVFKGVFKLDSIKNGAENWIRTATTI